MVRRVKISQIQSHRQTVTPCNKFNWNSLNIEFYINYHIVTFYVDSTKPVRRCYSFYADEGTKFNWLVLGNMSDG